MAFKGDNPPPGVSAQRRLCLRPQRIPGQAPPCEDDNIQEPGGYHHVRRAVTLPKLKFLEKAK